MSREGEGREPDMAEYAVKIPPLWPSDSMLWFAQVQAKFMLKGIAAQLTKFQHILANLSQAITTEVRDLLMNSPYEYPYAALKDTLITRTILSEQRRLQQLFSIEGLGDQKPAHLLHKMPQLLGEKVDAVDPSLLRGLFF